LCNDGVINEEESVHFFCSYLVVYLNALIEENIFD
jgi:hypothetical protein